MPRRSDSRLASSFQPLLNFEPSGAAMKRSNSFVNLELILPLESFRFTTNVRVSSDEELCQEEAPRTAPAFHRRFQSADETNSRQKTNTSGDRYSRQLPYSTTGDFPRSDSVFNFTSDLSTLDTPPQHRSCIERIHLQQAESVGYYDDEVAANTPKKEIIRPRILSVDDIEHSAHSAPTPSGSPYSIDYGFLQESPGIRLTPGQPLRFIRRPSPEPLYPPIVITTNAENDQPVASTAVPPAPIETMTRLLSESPSTLIPTSSTTASSSDNEELLELDQQIGDDGASTSSSIAEATCSKRFSTSSENDSDSTRMELEAAPSAGDPHEYDDNREEVEDEGVNEMMTSMVSATGDDEVGYQILENSSDIEAEEEREESATPTPVDAENAAGNAIPLDSIFNFEIKKSPSQELPVISEDVDEHLAEHEHSAAAEAEVDDEPAFYKSEASTSSDSESPTVSSTSEQNPTDPGVTATGTSIPHPSSSQSFDFVQTPSPPTELTVVHRRSVSDHVTPSFSLLQEAVKSSASSPSHTPAVLDDEEYKEEQQDLITDSPRLVRQRIVTGRKSNGSSRLFESRCKSQVLLGSTEARKEKSDHQKMLNKSCVAELDRSLSSSTPSINDIEGSTGDGAKKKAKNAEPAPVNRRTSSISVCEARTSSPTAWISSSYGARQGMGAPVPIRKKGSVSQPQNPIDVNQNFERRGSVARKNSTSQITAKIKSIFGRGSSSSLNAVAPNVDAPESPIYQDQDLSLSAEAPRKSSSSIISRFGKMRREKSDMSLFIASSQRTRKASSENNSPAGSQKKKHASETPVRAPPEPAETFAVAEPKNFEEMPVKMRVKKSQTSPQVESSHRSFRRSLDESALRLLRTATLSKKKEKAEAGKTDVAGPTQEAGCEDSAEPKLFDAASGPTTMRISRVEEEEEPDDAFDDSERLTTLQRRRRGQTPRKEDKLKHRIRCVVVEGDNEEGNRKHTSNHDEANLCASSNDPLSHPRLRSRADGHVEKKRDKPKDSRSGGVFTFLSMRHKKKKPDTRSLSNVVGAMNAAAVNPRSSLTLGATPTTELGSVVSGEQQFFPDGTSVHSSLTSELGLGRIDPNTSRLSLASLDNVTKNLTSDDIFANITLTRKKWEDLNIWEPEPSSWSNKYSEITDILPHERKKQDTIHELYVTEKHHCQVLIFLQQVYQVGVQYYNILTENELNSLIPDVLDSLLDFHLSLLRRLHHRRAEAPVVKTVADIICEEFGDGSFTHAAVTGYTTLCENKDRSGQCYEALMSKNSRFRKYFECIESDSRYKERSFKYCLLLVAQRPTKYTVLTDQLLKQEMLIREREKSNQNCESRDEILAYEAVKNFAKKIDSNLAAMELHRRWEHIQNNLDRSSCGRYLNKKFTHEDLTYDMEGQRVIMCIGQIQMKNVKEDRLDGVMMLLFDDILVFLHLKGGKYQFYNRPNHDCVFAVHSILIRPIARQNSVMIVVVDKLKNDMLEVMFNNKTDQQHWLTAFKTAKDRPTTKVRRAPSQSQRHDDTSGRDQDSEQNYSQEVELEKWERELCSLFSARKDEEKKFVDYFTRRMEWMDEVERHLSKVPGRQPKDSATAERLKFLVKSRYAELKNSRHLALDSLIEKAEALRMNSVVCFFDNVHDLRHATSSDSGPSTTEDSDDTSESGSSSGRVKPRRIRTFHGTVEGQEPRKKEGIRRHTTVPHLESSADLSVEDEEDMLHKMMSLTGTSRQRRAAKKLIKDAVNSRAENNRLRSELALREAQIAALKVRKTTIGSSETLEQLRTKQLEFQRHEKEAQIQDELRKDELKRRMEEIEQKSNQIKQEENELQAKWQVYYDRTMSPSQPQTPAVVIEDGPQASPTATPTVPNGGSRLTHQQSFRYGSVVHDQARTPRSPQRNSPHLQSSLNLSTMQNLVTKTESKDVKKKSKK